MSRDDLEDRIERILQTAESQGTDPGSTYIEIYSETERIPWSRRLGKSFSDAGGGFLLFIASFFLLFWSEGRPDISLVAQTAVEIQADKPAPEHTGKLVAATGPLTSKETLGDQFQVPGPYIALQRIAEMYAWNEDTETETTINADGSETRTTHYIYSTLWTSKPENSWFFRVGEGHHNPRMRYKSASYKVSSADAGIYAIDLKRLQFPSYVGIGLTPQNTRGGYPVVGGYIFIGEGTLGSPEVGDLRISYQAIPSGSRVLVFGKLEPGNRIGPFREGRAKLYRAMWASKSEAVAQMHEEHVLMTWFLRIIGLALMCFGLELMLRPLNVLMDPVPVLGRLGRNATTAIAAFAALVLAGATILMAKLLSTLVGLAAVIALALLVGMPILAKAKDVSKRSAVMG